MTPSARGNKGPDLSQGFNGDAIGGREHEDLVLDAHLVDSVCVDVIDVVAGLQDGGHQRGRDRPCMAPVTEMRQGRRWTRLIRGQQNGNLVGGLPWRRR